MQATNAALLSPTPKARVSDTARAAPPERRLADLLAEREPLKQARRLLLYVCTATRQVPLVQEPTYALTARSHAEALCVAVATALDTEDAPAALEWAEAARRALVLLRAVCFVAAGDGALHATQHQILGEQMRHVEVQLDALLLAARGVASLLGTPSRRSAG